MRDPDESDNLPDAFWRVARDLRHSSRDALAQWELSPSLFRALQSVARYGSLRSSELAEHLRIAPRSVTEVVDDLVERDLVQREPDPSDRRASLITLTTAGQQLAQSIREARDVEAERFFGVLSATDRAHLQRILRRLSR